LKNGSTISSTRFEHKELEEVPGAIGEVGGSSDSRLQLAWRS
jgi:hypothetical protein